MLSHGDKGPLMHPSELLVRQASANLKPEAIFSTAFVWEEQQVEAFRLRNRSGGPISTAAQTGQPKSRANGRNPRPKAGGRLKGLPYSGFVTRQEARAL